MLTTTIDGLWVLQVLTGIEVLAPELGLRPIMPSIETSQMALAHPIAAELRAVGVIDDSGVVDATVVEWLTVLARRDIALVMHVRKPDDKSVTPTKALLARFAQWWVVLERSEELVRISGAGTSGSESAANDVVTGQIERLCGTQEPAPLQPVTVDVNEVMTGVSSRETLRRQLLRQQLDGDQLQILMMAADTHRSARAFIVAVQSGVAGQSTRTHIEQSVVTIVDTPEGRLVGEHYSSAGKRWMIIAPGTMSSITDAVNRMMRRLPAEQEWYSYRKVV